MKPLTPNQQRVCEMLCDDYPDKAIAAELGVSFSSVRRTLKRAMTRLGVRGRVSLAVAFAISKVNKNDTSRPEPDRRLMTSKL